MLWGFLFVTEPPSAALHSFLKCSQSTGKRTNTKINKENPTVPSGSCKALLKSVSYAVSKVPVLTCQRMVRAICILGVNRYDIPVCYYVWPQTLPKTFTTNFFIGKRWVLFNHPNIRNAFRSFSTNFQFKVSSHHFKLRPECRHNAKHSWNKKKTYSVPVHISRSYRLGLCVICSGAITSATVSRMRTAKVLQLK